MARQIADLEAKLASAQMLSSMTTPKVTAEVNAVSVKLPLFTESNPELWFGKAEAQFVLRGVKDDTTKFCASALPNQSSGLDSVNGGSLTETALTSAVTLGVVIDDSICAEASLASRSAICRAMAFSSRSDKPILIGYWLCVLFFFEKLTVWVNTLGSRNNR